MKEYVKLCIQLGDGISLRGFGIVGAGGKGVPHQIQRELLVARFARTK